jgi:hypothetical protein
LSGIPKTVIDALAASVGEYCPHGDIDSLGTGMLGILDALYSTQNSVWVARGATAVENGANLRTAYTTAKALTPHGAALSATNRAVVILPPGAYALTETLTLDADYVDLVAAVPSAGAAPPDSFYEWTKVGDVYLPAAVQPAPSTYIYAALAGATIAGSAVVVQSANDVHFKGFGVLNSWTTTGLEWVARSHPELSALSGAAFCITATDNSASIYEDMWFWCRGAGLCDWSQPNDLWRRHSCVATSRFRGTWIRCVSNGLGYRQQNDAATMDPKMYDCIGGAYSYGGDYSRDLVLDGLFVRCRGTGNYELIYNSSYDTADGQLLPGYACFCGCGTYAGKIGANAVFEDCVAGDHSFGMSNHIAGKFYRCRAGRGSFAGNNEGSVSDAMVEAGAYLEDCVAERASFGGGNASATMAGNLVRCHNTSFKVGLKLTSTSTVVGCELTVTDAGTPVLLLLQSGASIRNNILTSHTSNKCIGANAGTLSASIAGNSGNTGFGTDVTNTLTPETSAWTA